MRLIDGLRKTSRQRQRGGNSGGSSVVCNGDEDAADRWLAQGKQASDVW
jgi:hypothetical protein